jgi:hypothetical protein
MNANELADMLAKSSIRKVSQGEVVVDVFEIATMLRQQQAEIEALKQSKSNGNNKVNLELTDEEITQIAYQTPLQAMTTLDIDCLVVFARTILRKAGEK